MKTFEEFEARRKLLEKDIAAAKLLILDLERQLLQTTDPLEHGKLLVNIEDVTNQLKDWEYELSDITDGKE